jgi:hypothetical protein
LQLLAEISADESAVSDAAGGSLGTRSGDAELQRGSAGRRFVSRRPGSGRLPLGEPPGWRFPALMCTSTLTLLALIVTVAVLAGREAAGSATLDPPFLSTQPCIVMLALIPCGIALIATRLGRIRGQR